MTGILGAPRAWRESSPTRWYLVFCESQRRRWWDHLFRTPAGFSHVYALRWDGFNWLMFNPHTAFTEVEVLEAVYEQQLPWLLAPGDTVLEVQAFRRQNQVRGRWWIGPMTCVEQVKALLGIPVGTIFTPWQLYKHLTEDANDGRQEQRRERFAGHGKAGAGGQGQCRLEEGEPRRGRRGRVGEAFLAKVIRRP